jgi:hypothetical protein
MVFDNRPIYNLLRKAHSVTSFVFLTYVGIIFNQVSQGTFVKTYFFIQFDRLVRSWIGPMFPCRFFFLFLSGNWYYLIERIIDVRLGPLFLATILPAHAFFLNMSYIFLLYHASVYILHCLGLKSYRAPGPFILIWYFNRSVHWRDKSPSW